MLSSTNVSRVKYETNSRTNGNNNNQQYESAINEVAHEFATYFGNNTDQHYINATYGQITTALQAIILNQSNEPRSAKAQRFSDLSPGERAMYVNLINYFQKQLGTIAFSWDINNLTQEELLRKINTYLIPKIRQYHADYNLLFAAGTQPQVQSSSEEKEVKETKEEKLENITFTKKDEERINYQHKNIDKKQILDSSDPFLPFVYYYYSPESPSRNKGRVNIGGIGPHTTTRNARLAIYSCMTTLNNAISENKISTIKAIKHPIIYNNKYPEALIRYLLEPLSDSHMILNNQITIYFNEDASEEQIISDLRLINAYFEKCCKLPPGEKGNDKAIDGCRFVSYRHEHACNMLDLIDKEIDTNKLMSLLKNHTYKKIYRERIISTINDNPKEYKYVIINFINRDGKNYPPDATDQLIEMVNQCVIKPKS